MIRETTISAKDFAIGVLSVTAVILLATLLLMNTFVPRLAYAAPDGAQAGNYIATAAQFDESAEALVLLDTQQRLMNTYRFRIAAWQVELINQVDLDRITKDIQRIQKEQANPPGPGMLRGPGAGARPRR